MFEPVLTKYVDEPNGHTLDFYVEHGGYQALRSALGMTPDAIVDVVKKSGLRGRGGAGFPTGLKWSFVPKDIPKPKYLCVNADESEPGTFKDHVLLERNPHLLYEGCVIACRAIGAKTCYIYIRGALIESLEGKRAQPRLKPPFPAVVGLYGCPTVVNNVETICNVPVIIDKGHEWYAAIGPEKNTGPKLFCVSGHVKKPGVYEGPMSMTLRELIYDHAGGIREDRQLKAIIPGGSSTPVLLPDKLDTPLSFDGMVAAGSMLGSAAVIVMDETTSMVWVAKNLIHFYKHESCGKCTPCREGVDWLYKILEKIERGDGELRDVELLLSVCDNIGGKTLCPFGDAEIAPVISTIQHFRDEYETYIRTGESPVHSDFRATEPVGAH